MGEVKAILTSKDWNFEEPNYLPRLEQIDGAWMNSPEKKSFDNYKKIAENGSENKETA